MPEGRIICIRDVSSPIINVSGSILVRRFKEEKSPPTLQSNPSKDIAINVIRLTFALHEFAAIKKNSRKRVNVNELISLSLSLLFLIAVTARVFAHPWFAPAICWRQMWSAILAITHSLSLFCQFTDFYVFPHFLHFFHSLLFLSSLMLLQNIFLGACISLENRNDELDSKFEASKIINGN